LRRIGGQHGGNIPLRLRRYCLGPVGLACALVAGSGAAGNSIVVPQVAISFTATSREVRLRLPPLGAGEGGTSFTLSPAGPGTYRATANWAAGSGPAELTFTAGTNVSRSEGPPGAQIMGSVSPAVEGTLAVRNTGSSTLAGLTATVLFP
jgi:hypothetical protein